jgi:hypothetical protein
MVTSLSALARSLRKELQSLRDHPVAFSTKGDKGPGCEKAAVI